MSSGKWLSDVEKGKIAAFKEEGLSNREIARRISWSHTVVDNFIRKGQQYGTKKSPGAPSVISKRDRSHILRLASNSSLSARAIKEQTGVSASVWTVRRVLNGSRLLQRKKMKKQPPLTPWHIETRMAFAQDMMSWTTAWQNVVFSDEKKFNLDGPDGYSYYWHDLRKEERVLSRRHTGGGSVMIWASIGYQGKSPIVFLEGRMNANRYIDLLRQQTNNFEAIAGDSFIFQQDNAPIHTAACVKKWLEENEVPCMPWPPRSPDLNIIENVWGLLAKDVYANRKQFDTKDELRAAIRTSWERIDQGTVKKLFDSIPKRIFEVIRLNGKFTKY